jgi:hypothetical protein
MKYANRRKFHKDRIPMSFLSLCCQMHFTITFQYTTPTLRQMFSTAGPRTTADPGDIRKYLNYETPTLDLIKFTIGLLIKASGL